MKRLYPFFRVVLVVAIAGCTPKVGSESWCEKMSDTPKSEWKGSDAKAFARHCLFKNYIED